MIDDEKLAPTLESPLSYWIKAYAIFIVSYVVWFFMVLQGHVFEKAIKPPKSWWTLRKERHRQERMEQDNPELAKMVRIAKVPWD